MRVNILRWKKDCMMNNRHVEIMAPAGSFESLQAAIQGGADSVYLGVGDLNMRARAANNFTFDNLEDVVNRCREANVKVYVTLNTIMYDVDLPRMRETCDRLKELEVEAVIAHDISVIIYVNSIGLKTHISTQANVCNIEAVKFFSQFADVIVLARELSLEQIRSICDTIRNENIRGPSGDLVKVEVFIHGALCVAISGKCYMSLAQHHASANRGACLQVCRRKYRVIEEDTGNELALDNQYIMSPKDLCTIEFLDQIIGAGVSVLKIEGRGRAPEYVYTVTKTYRDAVDSLRDGTFSKEKVDKWKTALETVYHRGFWHGGYYLGRSLGEWSGIHGSKATKRKEYVGKVTNYFAQPGVAEIKVEASFVSEGDHVLIIGPTTGVIESVVTSLRKHEKAITISVSEKVRRNDQLYLLKDKN